MTTLESLTKTLNAGDSLTKQEAELSLHSILSPETTDLERRNFLLALREKGESAAEIAGFVSGLNEKMLRVDLPGKELLDVCGTGGDRSGSFNVSTTVSLVVAAAGAKVAKHGNRSVSSRSGSFDVLESLGVSFDTTPALVRDSIEEFGIAFLFAPSFHPALKTLAAFRRELGVPTIFNILGPLLNPVTEVKRQLIGVNEQHLLPKVAQAAKMRGAREAAVVQGGDGLDELTLRGPSRVVHVKGESIREFSITPEEFGLKTNPQTVLKGGDPSENAAILISILKGQSGSERDVVLLNAGAALWVSGKARDPKDGAAQARESIDSGKALALLQKLRNSKLQSRNST